MESRRGKKLVDLALKQDMDKGGESNEEQASHFLMEPEPVPSTSSGFPSQTLIPPFEMDFSSDDSVQDPHYQPAKEKRAASSSSSEDELINVESPKTQPPLRVTESGKKSIRVIKKEKKIKRNSGLTYNTLKGKVIAGKAMKELGQCRMKCKERIPLSDRESLFKEYWQMGSYEKRSSYMAALIEIEDKATQRQRTQDPESQKFRMKTYKYFFVIHGKREPVFRGCLLKTLDESDNFIKTVAMKKRSSIAGTQTNDMRGKSVPKHKISDEKRQEIKEHILSFLSYESHYTRKSTSKKYLPTHLTINKMYELFCENRVNPPSIKIYSQEFHKLGLSFKKPRVDTCYTCDKFKMQIQLCQVEHDKAELILNHENHKMTADQAYEQKRSDTEKYKNDSTVQVYSFDLQQCLPTPALSSSVLTINDNKTGKAVCYIWNETIAARGANQIASCLFMHLRTNLPESTKRVIFYSDTCGGQNRNSHWVLVWCLVVCSSLAEDAPPGLVEKDSEQDLVAEATHTGPQQAQKREAALSNSYGEPLPPDAYGPPSVIPGIPNTISDAPVSFPGAEPIFESNFPNNDFHNGGQEVPQGAYGPPRPVVFPSQTYQGPPPPAFKPKPVYGPPKHHPPKPIYHPKPVYGVPKKNYHQKHNPKPNYTPFKPPKFSLPKPIYGVPKPNFGPKPVYGPPNVNLGAPINLPNIPLPELPPQVLGHSIDFGGNLPAPIYGTPFPSLPQNLQPNFPIPSDSYGPPGHDLGPIGPNDQLVVQDLGSIGHYGPPQPDPNPRPPHPGIPAPPTPPHVLYDGWKPIPGVSQPIHEHVDQNIDAQFEPPPPPPPQIQEVHLNLDGHSLPHPENPPRFAGTQINSGYSSVHQDALANIDLNSIIGGDTNHIDASKTVFEAHYTDNNIQQGHQQQQQQQVTIVHGTPSAHGAPSAPELPSGPSFPSGPAFPTGQGLPAIHGKPFDTYGAPHIEQVPSGPHSIRQFGAKGLTPPSNQYGVPPGSQYGAPPRPPPSNLPIPFGSHSGGGHNGFNAPRHPIKFRDSVPDGLIQQVIQTTNHKDHHGIDHFKQGPTYLPPPIREVKDINQQTGNHGNGLSLSIEPSNLYSLPHGGNPINFQGQQQPSTSYGSPIDSYSVPLLTVSDHTALGSNTNAVTATLDGTILANLSNLDAAAILKHCPYHEAILKAAKMGEKIPPELASSYVASLSSLGSTLSKNQLSLLLGQNSLNFGGDPRTKDLASASQTIVQTVVPSNDGKNKAKALRDASGKLSHSQKQDDRLQAVSQQILQTSEKIKNLSEEAKLLHQKINSANQNIQINNESGQFHELPVNANTGAYSVEIQSSDGKKGKPSIPHDQLLSEGLLQSILQAIEQPSQGSQGQTENQNQNQHQNQNQYQNQIYAQNQNQNFNQNQINQNKFVQTSVFNQDLGNIDANGLVLPAGYEPIDRTKQKPVLEKKPADLEVQGSNKNIKQVIHREVTHKHRGDIPHTECDLRADNSITHTIVIPAPSNIEHVKPVTEVEDNDVAIFFDGAEKTEDNKNQEAVTEISVATSISEDGEQYRRPEFGDKIKS